MHSVDANWNIIIILKITPYNLLCLQRCYIFGIKLDSITKRLQASNIPRSSNCPFRSVALKPMECHESVLDTTVFGKFLLEIVEHRCNCCRCHTKEFFETKDILFLLYPCLPFVRVSKDWERVVEKIVWLDCSDTLEGFLQCFYCITLWICTT